MQQGSVIQTARRQGPNVWSFRWSEKNRNGRRVYRKRVIGTVQQYPDAQLMRHSALRTTMDVYTQAVAPAKHAAQAAVLALFFPTPRTEDDETVIWTA